LGISRQGPGGCRLSLATGARRVFHAKVRLPLDFPALLRFRVNVKISLL